MKVTNKQIILVAQAIQGCGYPVESDLDAVEEFLEKLSEEIYFDSNQEGYRTEAIVNQVLDDLQSQREGIYAEREEQERKELELEYETEEEEDA